MQVTSTSLWPILFMGLTFATPVQVHAANHVVHMKSLSFDPKQITIAAGDTVEWENTSYTDHSANFVDDPEFSTPMVHPGKHSERIQFKALGDYKYQCSMHGRTMSGEILVKP